MNFQTYDLDFSTFDFEHIILNFLIIFGGFVQSLFQLN